LSLAGKVESQKGDRASILIDTSKAFSYTGGYGGKIMEILTGIFVLFCAGVVTGYSLLYVRSNEAPKKEPTAQVATQQSQDPGKAVGTSSAPVKEGQENSPAEPKPKAPQQ
jgi:hypothetical protein